MTDPRTTAISQKFEPLPEGHVDRTGCPWHDVNAMLRDVGLRPTRQRMALGWLLFGKGDRHLTAEMLYEEATRAKVPVSLATVYNTLHQFTDVGPAAPGRRRRHEDLFRHQFVGAPPLLRRRRRRTGRHSGSEDVVVGKMPTPPEGYEIARIDVVVRLRKKR